MRKVVNNVIKTLYGDKVIRFIVVIIYVSNHDDAHLKLIGYCMQTLLHVSEMG